MKLSEYIEKLQEFVKENPGSEDYTVVSSSDDEGNSFSEVYYGPTIGEWTAEDSEFHQDEEGYDDFKANAVCIN